MEMFNSNLLGPVVLSLLSSNFLLINADCVPKTDMSYFICNGGDVDQLQYLPAGIAVLKVNNVIMHRLELPTWVHHEYLFFLKIKKCGVTGMDDGIFVNSKRTLRNLYLDDNNLSKIKFGWLRDLDNLKRLSFARNRIHRIEEAAFYNLLELRMLMLSYNRIDVVRDNWFMNLDKLEELYLDNNQIYLIEDYSFRDLKNLGTLSLSHNELPFLEGRWFAHLGQLSTLDLSHNKISVINVGAFCSLKNLEKLDLSMNLIDRIRPSDIAPLSKLKKIILRDNNMLNITRKSKVFGKVKFIL